MSIIFLLLSVLSFAAAIVIKILFVPASEGIDITGAHVFFTVKLPIQDLPITEAQVNSWCVMLGILFLCLFLTSGLKTRNVSVRQLLAEWIVEKATNLVKTNMGEYFEGFAPFVAAILGLSAFSSLSSLLGLFPPTSDINITAGWAILVFILITYYKMKAGPWIYLKSFGQPVPLLAPLNIISEFATPVSMAFRHYGNVLSGSIISILVAVGLSGLSKTIFQFLPGALSDFPYLRIGIPAVLSLYFDLFSGGLQAFIFAMLTMLYISGGFPAEEYAARKKRREERRAARAAVMNADKRESA
ncbi:MAG: F0F1 ATP synthase subunit A [Clostridiales bacterium]|nr:F0F1 ATP synthase subunit A [Clostridiales bacterium]